MEKMTEKQIKDLSHMFGCTVEAFMIDFKKHSNRIDTECDDGKVRTTFFYRGKYITHKWKNIAPKDAVKKDWIEFWTITNENPHVRVRRVSACAGCPHYEEGVSSKDCAWNIANNTDKALDRRAWAAEDNDDRTDYREEFWVSTKCELLHTLDHVEHKKKEDRVFDDKTLDAVGKQLKFEEYMDNKPRIAKLLKALDNHKNYNMLKLVETLDSIQIEDLKLYLKDENMLIMSEQDVLRVVKGKYPVNDKNVYNSMLHLRDIVRLSERTLRDSNYGTVTSYIAYLEKIDDNTFISDDRFDYSFSKEWDMGNDTDNGVTEDQLSELIEHMTGIAAPERSMKGSAE